MCHLLQIQFSQLYRTLSLEGLKLCSLVCELGSDLVQSWLEILESTLVLLLTVRFNLELHECPLSFSEWRHDLKGNIFFFLEFVEPNLLGFDVVVFDLLRLVEGRGLGHVQLHLLGFLLLCFGCLGLSDFYCGLGLCWLGLYWLSFSRFDFSGFGFSGFGFSGFGFNGFGFSRLGLNWLWLFLLNLSSNWLGFLFLDLGSNWLGFLLLNLGSENWLRLLLLSLDCYYRLSILLLHLSCDDKLGLVLNLGSDGLDHLLFFLLGTSSPWILSNYCLGLRYFSLLLG